MSIAEKTVVLPKGTVVSRWIPVSERLPEETGMYLVTTVWDGFTGINIKEFTKYCEWYEYDMWQGERITAWMPLP